MKKDEERIVGVESPVPGQYTRDFCCDMKQANVHESIGLFGKKFLASGGHILRLWNIVLIRWNKLNRAWSRSHRSRRRLNGDNRSWCPHDRWAFNSCTKLKPNQIFKLKYFRLKWSPYTVVTLIDFLFKKKEGSRRMWIDRPTNGSQTSVYLSKKGLSFFRLKALVVQRFSNKQEQTTRPIPLWLVDFKAFDGSIWIETLESNAFDVRAKCLFILLCTIWDNWEYEKRKNLPPFGLWLGNSNSKHIWLSCSRWYAFIRIFVFLQRWNFKLDVENTYNSPAQRQYRALHVNTDYSAN